MPHPQKLHKIALHHSEIFRPKLKPGPLEIPHDFFLIIPGNSMLLLINTQEIHQLFLQPPEVPYPQPPFGFFLEQPNMYIHFQLQLLSICYKYRYLLGHCLKKSIQKSKKKKKIQVNKYCSKISTLQLGDMKVALPKLLNYYSYLSR